MKKKHFIYFPAVCSMVFLGVAEASQTAQTSSQSPSASSSPGAKLKALGKAAMGVAKINPKVLPPLEGSGQKRDTDLKWLTENLTKEEAENIQKRSNARYYIDLGGKVQRYSDSMVAALNSLPQLGGAATGVTAGIDPQAAFVDLINKVGSLVARGLQAYGRYKASFVLEVISTNEQIVEGAQKSYEEIQKIQSEINDLLGFKKEDIKIRRFKDLFSKRVFKNIDEFTDKMYLTNNKEERGERINALLKTLKEEKSTFNNYVATLNIKYLETQLMKIHKIKNRQKYVEGLSRNLTELEKFIEVFQKSVDELEKSKDKKDIKALPSKRMDLAEVTAKKDLLEAEKQAYETLDYDSISKDFGITLASRDESTLIAALDGEADRLKKEIDRFMNSLSDDESQSYDHESFEKLESRVESLEKRIESLGKS